MSRIPNRSPIIPHSAAIIGAMLAVAEGADPARTSLMCTFHDTQETRIGDIPHSSLGRLKTDTARRWAETAINHNPQHWLKQ